ncbi:hypothetical protein BGZ58_000227, partial [Dissophora ornata]
MAATLTLFCLVDGQSTSQAFKVEIDGNASIFRFKEAILDKIGNAGFKAKDLVLWQVTISIDENAGNESIIITLDGLDDKTKLSNPRTCLSKLFPENPADNTYIIVEPPK